MHQYSTDSNEREQVIPILALLAIGAAWISSTIMTRLSIAVPWWFGAPSSMGFYGVLFLIFDWWVWRLPILHRLALVKVPVLVGQWKGWVVSTHDNRTHPVQVEIKQTWTKIMIILQSKLSDSHTEIAAIQVHAPEGVLLSYTYLNSPRPMAKDTMQMHHGTARLVLKHGLDGGGESFLEGQYYSGRGRNEQGHLRLERVV